MNTFINHYPLNFAFLSFPYVVVSLMSLMFVLLDCDVTTFVNTFFLFFRNFKIAQRNFKVRAYNGSTLVTWEKQVESQKQI